MICDKCGFEHNSRSVCPKCGARVVYVNEDYQRRKREWEEAQKQGRKDAMPPGIMHSTREEHMAAKGRAEKEPETSKGVPVTVSLSFRVKKYLNIKTIKSFLGLFFEKICHLKDKMFSWYKKRFVKKRGADNPIIRELKFDDSPDTLDESNLVVSHKVYKDYRRYYCIGGGVLLLITAAIIIIVNVVRNIDKSKVFYFDGKFAYLADEPEKPLFGNIQGNITVICNESANCLAYDSNSIYLYVNGNTTTYQVNNPDIITYNEALDTVVYVEEGSTYLLHNGESIRLEMPENAEYSDACIVSDGGKYFALTICENNDTYSLYRGSFKGEIEELQQSDMAIELYNLSDDGLLSYAEMTTAEYGIINRRNIMQYDDGIKCLAENVNRYEWSYDYTGVYFTTKEDKMYYASKDSTREFIDEEVTAFVTNILDDEIYYYKNNKCYMLRDKTPYYICNMSGEGCKLIYDSDMDIEYYYDRTNLYAVSNNKETKYSLKSDESFVFFDNDLIMYVLDSDGQLIQIKDGKKTSIVTVDDNVLQITAIEGMDGIAYLSEGHIYVLDNDKNQTVQIYDTNLIDKVVFSGKHYYLTDKNNILWRIASNGKNAQSLGNVQIYNLVD